MDFYEDLLREVVGIIVIDDHFPDMPIDLLLILAHQYVESEIFRFRIAQLFKQILVFQETGMNTSLRPFRRDRV